MRPKSSIGHRGSPIRDWESVFSVFSRSGCRELIESALWCFWGCSGGQAQMAKDPGNDRWALDCGDNLQLTATV